MALTKPTQAEVNELFFKKGVKDKNEALKFYAYYETVGWVVGRRVMRSWRAAVAGWCLRMDQFKPQNKFQEKPTETVYKSIVPTNTKAQNEEERLIREGYNRMKIN